MRAEEVVETREAWHKHMMTMHCGKKGGMGAKRKGTRRERKIREENPQQLTSVRRPVRRERGQEE